jgi:hypothetical protein
LSGKNADEFNLTLICLHGATKNAQKPCNNTDFTQIYEYIFTRQKCCKTALKCHSNNIKKHAKNSKILNALRVGLRFYGKKTH